MRLFVISAKKRSTKFPEYPKFQSPPEGGITAWYTMRLTELGNNYETSDAAELTEAINRYEQRDRERTAILNTHFGL